MIKTDELTASQKRYILDDFAKYLHKRKLLTNGAVFETMPQYGIYADNGFYSLDAIIAEFNSSKNKDMLNYYKKQILQH